MAESASGTTIPGALNIVDSEGATWVLVGGIVYRSGTRTISSGVKLLLYYNKVIYQQNTPGNWWAWVNGGWKTSSDPRVTPQPTPTPTPGPTPRPTPTPAPTPPPHLPVGETRLEFWMDDKLVNSGRLTDK